MSGQDDLKALAREIRAEGVHTARRTTSSAPWYQSLRADMAHAANCFAVADALDALPPLQEGEGHD